METAPEGLRDTLGSALSPETILKTLDGRSLFSSFAELTETQSTSFLKTLGLLAGMLLLASVWKLYRREKDADGTGNVLSLLCSAIMAVTVFGVLGRLTETVGAALSGIHSAMTAAVTTVTCLSALRGNVTEAAVMRSGMGLFLAFSESVCAGLLFPLVRLCGGMSVLSVLCGEVKPGGISAFLRKTFLFVTGALMTLLTAVLSCQKVLAKSADSVSLRAVRFALGASVPVIGSAVGEAASAVGAGFSLLEKSAGVLGILIVLWQVVPPLLTLFLGKTVFSLCASFGELLELDAEAGLLREAETLAGFLCAVITAESVLYFLLLSLCMGGAA